MNHPVFAANWKMNHGLSATRRFLQTFLSHYPRQYDRTMIFFPASVSITTVVEAVKHRPDIEVGAQNIHWEDQGAFTGEISASMAREAGASFTLVGHSERRHIFGETDEQCALKCAAAHRAGLTPMLCVGETLDEREKGDTEKVVARQLRSGLSRMPVGDEMDVLIAYEPVWAIGTGRNATPEDASAIHAFIRGELRELTGERGGGIPILYGGSVNVGNVASLLAAPQINGVLVGGASLDVSSWGAIARTATAAPDVRPELTGTE